MKLTNDLIRFFIKSVLSGVLMSALVPGAMAAEQDGGISLSRTRVVLTSTDKAQSITIKNHGQRTYLVKSAIAATPGGQEPVPFIVTPPLFRLEANSQNTLRILRQDIQGLAKDRESVFYLSAIMVPSSEKPDISEADSMSARVSVGVQNIIKLFYRPAGLLMTPAQAEKALIFTQHSHQVQVRNPTPYYLTFAHLSLDGVTVNVRDSVSMIPPFAQISYPVSGVVHKAQWSVINDYGGNSQPHQAAVQIGDG